MTLKSQDKKRRMEQYYVNSFQNANWFKKRKKIDSECYSEGLTCVILTKKMCKKLRTFLQFK